MAEDLESFYAFMMFTLSTLQEKFFALSCIIVTFLCILLIK